VDDTPNQRVSSRTFQSSSLAASLRQVNSREGEEITQVYVSLPSSAGESPKRLVGWQKVELKAGESKSVLLKIDLFTFPCSMLMPTAGRLCLVNTR
jgi:beta-glucosidase